MHLPLPFFAVKMELGGSVTSAEQTQLLELRNCTLSFAVKAFLDGVEG